MVAFCIWRIVSFFSLEHSVWKNKAFSPIGHIPVFSKGRFWFDLNVEHGKIYYLSKRHMTIHIAQNSANGDKSVSVYRPSNKSNSPYKQFFRYLND